jgi:regulator of protease activity HflC (stomatin/prohibitin superfamily)
VFLFILAILFLIIALLGILPLRWAKKNSEDVDAGTAKITGWAMIGVFTVGAVMTLLASMVNVVPTKTVGIVTEFGKPTGELSNGLHLTAPWATVHQFNAAIQTDTYLNKTDQGSNACVDVRIANQSVACVEVTIRWRIKPHSAPVLYRDYRNFEHVRDSLVTRELRSALNNEFASYDPLGLLQSGQVPADVLDAAGGAVQKRLTSEIGDQVDVLSVIIPIVNFDQSTQTNINKYQVALAENRITAQQVITAQNQAKANEALAASLKNDPGVLTSKCLDILAKGVTLPPGFQCFPNTSGNVVVPSK